MPTTSPRATREPEATCTSLRYERDTLNPETGSIVTVLMPATEPANVTFPETGALTASPTVAA